MGASTHPKTVSGKTPDKDIPTYYGKPALKPSLYGWTVGLYIFVGGLAAGTQILVTAIELIAVPGSERIVVWGRVIALCGAILGGILLIADLHTKQRFYNMLRIFRPTSPMSIGTYVLMNFGFWSLIAVVLQWLGFALLATICGVLASVAGWFMTSYTASLLAATSTPLWAAAPKLLTVRFASSAMATGGATICLLVLATGSAHTLSSALGRFTALALLIELTAALTAGSVYRAKGVHGPLSETRFILLNLVGADLCGVFVPLCLLVAGNFFIIPPMPLAWIASVLVLIGGVLMRSGILLVGKRIGAAATRLFPLCSAGRSAMTVASLPPEIQAHGEAALRGLNELPHCDSSETRKKLADIMQQLVQMRDGLIVQRRDGLPVDHWLRQTDGIVSSLFGTEFPVNGHNKKRVDETRAALEVLLTAIPRR